MYKYYIENEFHGLNGNFWRGAPIKRGDRSYFPNRGASNLEPNPATWPALEEVTLSTNQRLQNRPLGRHMPNITQLLRAQQCINII